MPTIVITDLSPQELLKRVVDDARKATRKIRELQSAPLAPSETLQDRAYEVAKHGHVLAEAFELIDLLLAPDTMKVDATAMPVEPPTFEASLEALREAVETCPCPDCTARRSQPNPNAN